MIEITARDLVEKADCKLLIGNLDEKVKECFVNSKELVDGGCFFGIKGNKEDGSLFYKEAFDNGASICVINKIYDLDLNGYDDKTVLISNDTLKTLQKIAGYKRSLFKGDVVAVTGSVGKTSTKNMIKNILESRYKVLSNKKNQNSQVGVPLTIMRYSCEDVIVLEMGMSEKGEMHNLSLIAKPTIIVITNILDSHIENFGTRENIFKAKLEILDGMIGNKLILNNDNDVLNNYHNDAFDILTFGILNKSSIMANDIKEDIITKFDIDGIKDLTVFGGTDFVYNALASILVGRLFKVSDDVIKEKVNSFKNEKHRLEIINLANNITLIDDTYNANYDSVMAAIKLISRFKNKRKIVILGDILELGNKSKKIHKKLGKNISKFNIDLLITIGKNSRQVKRKCIRKIKTKHFSSELMARKYIKNNIKENDVILFKGSNGIGLVNLVEYVKKLENNCKNNK